MGLMRWSLSSVVRLVLVIFAFVSLSVILRTPVTQYPDYFPTNFHQADSSLDNQNPNTPTEERLYEEGSEPQVNGEERSTPRSRISPEMQEYLSWEPPTEQAHYPPYDQYRDRDYDPNRWEAFDQNNKFYTHGSVRQLLDNTPTATPYLPYPQYNTDEWFREWKGEYVYCHGPRGVSYNQTVDDMMTAYNGVPQGFPPPDVGSYAAVGLDAGVCFDRYSRLGAYGLDEVPAESTTVRVQVDFSKISLGQLQNDCLERNQARYEKSAPPDLSPGMPGSAHIDDAAIQDLQARAPPSQSSSSARLSYKSRTAILIRSWDLYEYQENDFQAIRSLVSELSLLSGGEYHVFLFVNVKDLEIPIFSDPKAYEDSLTRFVPAELRDMAILWSEEVCQRLYPKVGEWSVYWQQFMPLQWFSMTHPEFDNIWNWEMDARYIGQHYHFVEQISEFARNQPRKYLWERNSRYYIPDVHGSYEDYVRNTNEIVATSPHIKTVWGPDSFSPETQVPLGPRPPTSESDDNFKWGVGEDADFITLLPMWDPRETVWSYRDKVFNYPPSPESTEDRPYPHVPRRVFINTLARFSKKLLHAMHIENAAGLAMASEMWPSSIALQHGLKAVYAPHPIWFSHNWPGRYADFVFNADGWGAGSLTGGGDMDSGRGVAYNATAELLGEPQIGTGPNGEGKLGRWSQERDAPYSPDREHNFAGWSWYFWSDFPRVLYSRWMGWKAGLTIVTIDGRMVTDTMGVVGGPEWEAEHGRMCLPGMLLHPVKNVKPPEHDPPDY